jgi:uncharacterized protein
MLCPNDGATLLMTDRQGVEIDYCPTCRGVWLDRGELDKIVERAARELGEALAPPPPPPSPPPPPRSTTDDRRPPRYDDRYDDRSRYDDPRYRKRKKRSFLDDIFDFD